MCKWCENYRFTINATSKKNLIDHGDFYVPANYCPVCGTLLNENLKKDNDLNKRYIIRVKPNATGLGVPVNGQNYYYTAEGMTREEVVFETKNEARSFKTYFEAKCTADWFFKEEDYEIEEITVKKTIKKETETGRQDKAVNFRITDDALGTGSAKEKFRANMDAIRLLHQIVNIAVMGVKGPPVHIRPLGQLPDGDAADILFLQQCGQCPAQLGPGSAHPAVSLMRWHVRSSICKLFS